MGTHQMNVDDGGSIVSIQPDREEISGLFEAALEALAFPVLLHDAAHVVFANGAARTILGAVTRADIEGVPLDTFLSPELRPAAHERRAYILGDHVALSEVPIKMNTLDGGTIRLSVDARPVVFEGRTYAVVSLTAHGNRPRP